MIQKAEKKGELIGVVCQRDPEVDVPLQEDLYKTGVFAKVMKLLTLPNGNITAIVQCHSRLQLNQITQTSPYLEGDVETLFDLDPEKRDREFKTAMEDLRDLVSDYINVSEDIPDEATFAIKNITNNIMALNFVCSNMPFPVKEKIKLLEMESVKERLFNVMKIINREINLQNLKADIRNKTREDIDEQQRNYFLQQQIKNMQAEMGNESSPEKYELMKKAEGKKWPAEISMLYDLCSMESDMDCPAVLPAVVVIDPYGSGLAAGQGGQVGDGLAIIREGAPNNCSAAFPIFSMVSFISRWSE